MIVTPLIISNFSGTVFVDTSWVAQPDEVITKLEAPGAKLVFDYYVVIMTNNPVRCSDECQARLKAAGLEAGGVWQQKHSIAQIIEEAAKE